MSKGKLLINVYCDTIANPVNKVIIKISKENNLIKEIETNESGSTEIIELDTVEKEYSLNESSQILPYETYDIEVSALGLITKIINDIPIFENETSIQNIYLESLEYNNETSSFNISPNNLWETSSFYIENNDDQVETYVLNRVVIPENIIVHDGIPTNTNASNYTVPFLDYIKNVASSEIYPTWPEEALKANILAIISFTLNRIYTEWYLSKGYNFTITSTTTYDQKYTRNGTIYLTISNLVDDLFRNYLRQGIRVEPLLAHYKSSTTEKGYLSQWGSKDLATKGKTYKEILSYYYGDNLTIATAPTSQEYPYSYSESLKEGACSKDVYILQNTLNYIRSSYPKIPVIENPNGKYLTRTVNAIKEFQSIFSLPQTGITDYKTWYKISYIYIAVSKMTNSIY